MHGLWDSRRQATNAQFHGVPHGCLNGVYRSRAMGTAENEWFLRKVGEN
jgi:hypothetical protein